MYFFREDDDILSNAISEKGTSRKLLTLAAKITQPSFLAQGVNVLRLNNLTQPKRHHN